MQPVALKERALRAARNPSPSLACVGLLVDGSSVRAVSVERLVSSALCRCSARRTLSRDTACVLSGVGRGGCRRRRSCSPEPLRGRHFISVPLTESLCVAGGGFEATRSERDRPMTCSVTKREERVGSLLQVTAVMAGCCWVCLIATTRNTAPAVHGRPLFLRTAKIRRRPATKRRAPAARFASAQSRGAAAAFARATSTSHAAPTAGNASNRC